MEHWCCDETGLLKALYDYVPFTRDGICVLHKEGHYSKGPTELALFWKDLTCSRYLIETDMTGKQTEDQVESKSMIFELLILDLVCCLEIRGRWWVVYW